MAQIFLFIWKVPKQKKFIASDWKELKKKKKFNLNTNGSQVRDFIHIKDATRKIFNISKVSNIYGEYNISTGKGVKVKDFIRKYCLAKKFDHSLITYGNKKLPFYEPKIFWGSSNKFNKYIK